MQLARRCTESVRSWALWAQLPHWLAAVVLGIIAADGLAIVAGAVTLRFRFHDLILFALLLGCVVVTVELMRQVGEKKGLVKDVFGAWALPAACLLPPVYVLVLSIAYYSLTQWRVKPTVLYRRLFSAAVIGLSFAAAGLVFRAIRMMTGFGAISGNQHLVWFLALSSAVLVHEVINKGFMILAIRGSDATADIQTTFFSREPLYNDLAELCIGALITYTVATNIFLVPVALPVAALLQRSLRHAQLLNDSRTDAKTGLLNARTWESEAESEVARAVRARMALAVAVLDIDFFKQVNDTYGHLFGDEVLREIARCLPGVLREYDSAGRFGGEEFVLLLPHTRAVDAFRIADRVRDHISGLSLIAPDGQQAEVTVSVGVAALDAGSARELSELLAAADAALYRAKRDGRNQVQMISTTRGLSASGARAATNVNAFGGGSPAPSAWDLVAHRTPPRSSDADGVTAGALPRRLRQRHPAGRRWRRAVPRP